MDSTKFTVNLDLLGFGMNQEWPHDTLEDAIKTALWVDTWGDEMPGTVNEIRQGEKVLWKDPLGDRHGFFNSSLRKFATENGIDVTPYKDNFAPTPDRPVTQVVGSHTRGTDSKSVAL